VSDTVLEARQLRKVYRMREIETVALASVDVAIERGSYAVLTGPSGCGKSTLLSLLGLIDVPTSGDILVDGVRVSDLGDSARARIRGHTFGFIYQAYNLIAQLTARENIELPLSLHHDLTRAQRRERALEQLERVGLKDRAQHYPDQLSGGEQQRVAVARALVTQPKVLFADEPTGNLDTANGDQVMSLIDEAHVAGTTICLVTHDPRFVGRGTHAHTMKDGMFLTRDARND
jgi:putative ABC transport system ATP-binding protein